MRNSPIRFAIFTDEGFQASWTSNALARGLEYYQLIHVKIDLDCFCGSSHKCVHDPTSSGQADGYHYSAPARIRCPESLDSSMLPRSAAISRANPAAAQASLFMLAIGRPIGTRPRFLHVADSMAVYPLLAPGPCTDS